MVCAIAYTMAVEDLHRELDGLLLTVAVARGMGADVEPVDVADVRVRFDAQLCEQPQVVRLDPGQVALRQVLGLKVG